MLVISTGSFFEMGHTSTGADLQTILNLQPYRHQAGLQTSGLSLNIYLLVVNVKPIIACRTIYAKIKLVTFY